MTTTGKVLVGIIVVLIIAGGAYYWYAQTHNPATAAVQEASTPDAMAGMDMSTSSMQKSDLPSGTGTSDTSLNQDTAAIDAQMNGLDSDNSDVNSSINDQPVSQ